MPTPNPLRIFLASLLSFVGAIASAPAADRPPNIVLVFCDDLGYGDLGCYGSKQNATPNLDRMAREGTRLTSFYVPQAVCSASRCGLLTGCYPNRLGILGALGPRARIGIAAAETTIAEALKPRGYATAIYGKWHLGHHEQFLPTNHGFDDYYGLPYSNDMWPKHPTAAKDYPALPLIAGTKTIAENPDQRQLTEEYTKHAEKFIAANKDRPFFLYVPHSMPHVPIFASEAFANKSGHGLYADVIAEIDASVGRILAAIKSHGLDERTVVIFTSDNGPWLSYGNHAGVAGPLREGKGTAWEGGVRVPCIVRWPGHVRAAATTDEMAATIDLLPTFVKLAGATLPERPIDGIDAWPILSGQPDAKAPADRAFYFYWGQELHAIRQGRHKLHFPHPYRSLAAPPGKDGKPNGYREAKTELALYDVVADIGERNNIADQKPEIVAELVKRGDLARADLGDTLTKTVGRGVRKPDKLPDVK